MRGAPSSPPAPQGKHTLHDPHSFLALPPTFPPEGDGTLIHRDQGPPPLKDFPVPIYWPGAVSMHPRDRASESAWMYVFLAVLDLCCSGISVVSVSRGYFWLLCAASHCGDSLVAESGLYELLLLLLRRFSRV